MAALNFLERNALVRALRSGKKWDEAIKVLPLAAQRHRDLAKNWREWAEAEAKTEDASVAKVVRLDADEFVRLREENVNLKDDLAEAQALAEKLNADLAEARKEIETLTSPGGKKR